MKPQTFKGFFSDQANVSELQNRSDVASKLRLYRAKRKQFSVRRNAGGFEVTLVGASSVKWIYEVAA